MQLEALVALFQLVQYMPNAFLEAEGQHTDMKSMTSQRIGSGNSTVLHLLQATRSREVQKKSLHLLQVAVRMGKAFAEKLGELGASTAVVSHDKSI